MLLNESGSAGEGPKGDEYLPERLDDVEGLEPNEALLEGADKQAQPAGADLRSLRGVARRRWFFRGRRRDSRSASVGPVGATAGTKRVTFLAGAGLRLTKMPNAGSRWTPWSVGLWRLFDPVWRTRIRCSVRPMRTAMVMRVVVRPPWALRVLVALNLSARGAPAASEEEFEV